MRRDVVYSLCGLGSRRYGSQYCGGREGRTVKRTNQDEDDEEGG